MANNHFVQPPSIHLQNKDHHKKGIWAAIPLLVPIAAAIVLGGGTGISDGFEPFMKSANEVVSEGFEDVKSVAPVSDELGNAMASLSQSLQAARKPPVQAEGQ